MTLSSGTRLGPYEILAPIGAGGMGEVYRAKDTRLERTVAVKVLPSHLAASPESRQRFEREAKTISQLSHPHICALYDVGRDGETEFLVMELLEGETLSERLAKGPLPLESTLRYGTEIADALDKAHRQGIVHRDLKPGNVMLTKSGVKLLDFGLAKAMAPAAGQSSLTALPTQQGVTQEGTILGTFQYMAPEQLEGREADARTDIFALGATLYEMATGKKAFAGATQASLITAIMSSDPPSISSAQPMSPAALERVVKTCLAKDPEDRWQSAADIKRELKWIGESSQAGVAAPVAARRGSRERLAWAVAALAVAGAAAWTLLGGRQAPHPEPTVKFTLPPPAGLRFGDTIALSPDGRRIAFLSEDSGRKRGLWVRALDDLTPRLLSGAGTERFPFWSADGRTVAFFEGNRLRRIDVGGGSAQTICETGAGFGGSWEPAGTIVYASEFGSTVFSVSAAGGKPVAATALDAARGDVAHLFPVFLPDGRHFVFVARNRDPEKTAIALGELGSTRTRALFHAESAAIYADPGYLLFAREGALLAQRFDPRRLEPEGEATSVADDVLFFTDMSGLQATVGGQALAYGRWFHKKKLVWLDRKGAELGTLGAVGDYGDVSISPDGRRVAVSMADGARGQNMDVWVLDAERGQTSRLTSERTDEFHASWSPDGRWVAYVSDHAGFYDLYRRPAEGGAEEALLLTRRDKSLDDISADGRFAIYNSASETPRSDLWALPLPAGSGDPIRLTQTPAFTEATARLSPDGHWLMFRSDESGRPEVYVQPFPRGPKRQVSSGGGDSPVWRRDGREIYYVSPDGRLTSVAVSFKGGEIEAGTPQPLFDLRLAPSHWLDPRPYDVAPDGQRFLAVRRVEDAGPDAIIVNLHWTAGLKKP